MSNDTSTNTTESGGTAGLSESATEAIREIVREELHDESGGPNVSRRNALAALGGGALFGGVTGGAAGQSTGGQNNLGVAGMSLNVSEDYHVAGDYYAGPASARPANPGSNARVRWDVTDAGPSKQTEPTYWDGSQWDTMGLKTDVVDTDETAIGDSPDQDATLAVRTGDSSTPYPGYALALQNLDDTANNGEGKANIGWVTDSGHGTSVITSHPTHAHFSLYMRDDPDWVGGSGNLAKVLDVGPGEGASSAEEFGWKDQVGVIEHDQARSVQYGNNISSGEEFALQMNAAENEHIHISLLEGGSRNWLLQSRHTGTLRLFNDQNGEPALDISGTNSAFDFNQNTSENVVWESDTTANRPSGPAVGQRYFDTDLGQPIWYDGSNWVDAQGTSV